jgi:hypothetical protein
VPTSEHWFGSSVVPADTTTSCPRMIAFEKPDTAARKALERT